MIDSFLTVIWCSGRNHTTSTVGPSADRLKHDPLYSRNPGRRSSNTHKHMRSSWFATRAFGPSSTSGSWECSSLVALVDSENTLAHVRSHILHRLPLTSLSLTFSRPCTLTRSHSLSLSVLLILFCPTNTVSYASYSWRSASFSLPNFPISG